MNAVGTDFASSHVRFLNEKRVMTRKEKRMIFGGCVGEGLAAVCGYQSGAQGMRVAMPAFSPGDRNGRGSHPLPGTSSVLFVSLSHVSFMSHV